MPLTLLDTMANNSSATAVERRSFSEELFARRKPRYPSATEFGKLIGSSQGEVSRWERGDVRGASVEMPTDPEQVKKISDLLAWPIVEMQAAAAETRRRLVMSGQESVVVPDHAIIYAAGWAELTPKQQSRYIRMIEEDAKELEEKETEENS